MPSRRRKAPTPCGCSRSTRRRGSSSRSSSSRTPAVSRPPVSDILALSDGRFGFKVAHPATGTRVGTESYRDVKEHREQAERAERLRLYYVAMTRARERLIVSGSIGAPGDAGEETPIAWVLERLGLEEEARQPSTDGPFEIERGAATVVLRVDHGQPAPDRAPAVVAEPVVLATEAGQLALFEGSGEALPPPAPRLRELTVVPDPPLHRVARLSFSALSLFERCSYRYYAERVVGMRPTAWAEGAGGGAGALHPTEIGDAVHRLLELVDLARPAVAGRARRARSLLVPGRRPTPSSRTWPRSSTPTASRRLPDGSPGWTAFASSGRSHSSSTACC